MPQVIIEPGRWKLPAADYHGDPCPQPSLSSTITKILLKESPLHAWHNHPRLNPNITPRQATFMDIGSVAHELLLQDGKQIIVIDAPDYRTKAAQEARDAAYAQGNVPILAKYHRNAQTMVNVADVYLREAFGKQKVDALRNHPERHTEQALIWQEHVRLDNGDKEKALVWCRSLVDWIQADGTIIDYKTTATSVRSDNIERHLFAMDYHIQNAFYERGMDVLMPDSQGRRRFLFLFQEIAPPFACQLIQVDEGALTLARRMIHEAIATWAHCLRSGQWPCYPARPAIVFMPGWQESKWLAHEETSGDPIALPDYLAAG